MVAWFVIRFPRMARPETWETWHKVRVAGGKRHVLFLFCETADGGICHRIFIPNENHPCYRRLSLPSTTCCGMSRLRNGANGLADIAQRVWKRPVPELGCPWPRKGILAKTTFCVGFRSLGLLLAPGPIGQPYWSQFVSCCSVYILGSLCYSLQMRMYMVYLGKGRLQSGAPPCSSANCVPCSFLHQASDQAS